MTVLRVGLNRLQRFTFNEQQSSWTMDAGISRGLNALNANVDSPDIQASEAHSQFIKLGATASATLPLGKTGDPAWIWRGQFTGQWSRQALFGSEQIYAGGVSSVRGFREGGISGDRGFYLRSDLIWSHVPEWNGIRSEPYAFLDAGRTELIARARYEQIVGTGVGVRLQAAYGKQVLSGEVLAGRPLQQPAELGKKKTIVLATLNWTY